MRQKARQVNTNQPAPDGLSGIGGGAGAARRADSADRSTNEFIGVTPIADLAVVGAGAAGLMAAITAGRLGRCRSIAVLEGARRPGAKILVSGGGRCNVTHDLVDETAFYGSTPAGIRKVLRRFEVADTIRFFEELGVRMVREETGKLFPVDGNARSVLNALLSAAGSAGAQVMAGWRVASVRRENGRFEIVPEITAGREPLRAREVILATGGRSLPKSGSDGHGYSIARSLGHTITPRVLPALVPLTIEKDCPIRDLPGVACDARASIVSSSGRRLASIDGPVLCTHFGLSGPAILDVSRHLIHTRLEDPGARLVVSWSPGETSASLDALLVSAGGAGAGHLLSKKLPARLAVTLCALAGVDPAAPCARLERTVRRRLAGIVTGMEIPVTGDRGFTYAEVTAGGVPLAEMDLTTMRSRACPGLMICGEICDVDGRIGGHNFQWAWASGFVAGSSAGMSRTGS